MAIFQLNKDDMKTVASLFRMHVRDRYLGSYLGMFWAVSSPLLMLLIYTFVFGFVFKSKIPGSDSSLGFVVWLISGYAAWFGISDGLINSSTSVVSGISLIKNIPFKTELLVLSNVMLGIIPMGVGIVVLMVLLPLSGIGYSINIIWLLVIVPLQFLFLIGVGFFLAAISVFIRDIVHMLPSILMLFLFFTPIFYPIETLPAIVQKITFFNPFYHLTQPYRDIFIQHHAPNPYGLLYLVACSIVLWFFGLKFFRRLKGYFESVL